MQLNCFLFARTSGRLHAPPRRGLTGRVYPRLISASAGRGNRQKIGAKTQVKKLLVAWLRLVGSLRRTARAWGFSHHENPLAKPGCPSSIGAVAAGGAARKEHIIHLHTYAVGATYLRAGKAQPRFQRIPSEKEERSVSQVNHQKFCRHRTRGPLERLIV